MTETKTKEKAELVTKEETRPETSFGDVERYFDRLFRHPFSLMMPQWPLRDFPRGSEISPTVDIFEAGGEMVVKAELPGISKENLHVTIEENTLTISGEKKQEEKIERKEYHRIERSYGSFCRSFRLPDTVNGDKAKATFKDGVLEVRLPRTKKAQQKKITIT